MSYHYYKTQKAREAAATKYKKRGFRARKVGKGKSARGWILDVMPQSQWNK